MASADKKIDYRPRVRARMNENGDIVGARVFNETKGVYEYVTIANTRGPVQNENGTSRGSFFTPAA